MGGTDVRVHLSDEHDEDNTPEAHVIDIGLTNKEGINILLRFTEPQLAGEFNFYQKRDMNPPLSLAMGMCMGVYFIVHLSYQSFFRTSNPFYLPAFLLGLVVAFSGSLLLILRFALVIPSSMVRSRIAKRLHNWLLELDRSPSVWMFCNSSLVISLSIASSLFVLARVIQGPCDPHDLDWRAQQKCNNGRLTGLPTEEYVLNLFTVLLVQVCLKGSNRKSLLFAWVGKFAIMMACLGLSEATTHAWVCYHFAIGMGISYEVSGNGSGKVR